MNLTLPAAERCYFCDIVRGHADRWNVLAEDELTMTLLNGRQYETGQSLVIPTRHAPTLMDLGNEEAAAVIVAAKHAAKVLLRAFDATGVLLYQNNGVGSGQEVPHFHLHIVPRQPGSDWGLGPPPLARAQSAGRASRFEHTTITQEKRDTVRFLRDQWR